MKEVFFLETPDQVKAISHPLRMAILRTFSAERECVPQTAKMIAEVLEETPSKVYYHLKELMNAGILAVVDTREINGITERFYQPVARHISLEKNVYSRVLHILPEEEKEFRTALKKVLDQYDHRGNPAAHPLEWLVVMYPPEVKKKK